MKTRTRWILAALIVLLLPVLVLVPLTKAQAARNPVQLFRAAIAQLMPQAPGQQVAARNGVSANRAQLPPLSGGAAAAPAARIQAMAGSPLLTTSSGTTAHTIGIPPMPKSPQVVLYDQYNNGSALATLSATFSDFPTFGADLGDDFVVPAGQTWSVESVDADGVYFNGAGPADSFNVFFYADNAGLPGAQVYSALNQPVTQLGTTFTVNLAVPAVLAAGTYWVEEQANMNFAAEGEWGWTDRTVQSNNTAAWQNPGGGFGICPSWTRKATCVPTAGGPDQVFRLNGTIVSPTPTPTPPPGCQFHVLIAYADSQGTPADLQSQILAESGVISADLFDAAAGTPTLAQLQSYEIVVPFSNTPFLDGDTLGNNLADYVDAGGIVAQLGFSHYGPGQPYGINGRWLTGNYNPYDYSANLGFTAFTLGTFNAAHPLMAGVTTLNSNFQNIVAPAAGATEVAAASDGSSLVAYCPVSGGHTTVGITAYVGAAATESGHWGRVIVNAGRWLSASCQTPTPTNTPTNTPTDTPVPPTNTPTNTPTDTPVPPTNTPTNTPTPTPTAVTGNQGCGPGYWKQQKHLGSWCGGFIPTGASATRISSVFTIPSCLSSCKPATLTLLQALSLQGGNSLCGAEEILLRAAAAALLNSCSVSYPLSTAQVISEVNTALASCNRATMLTEASRLDGFNNGSAGCPLP